MTATGRLLSFKIKHPDEPLEHAIYGTGANGAFVTVSYGGLKIEALAPGEAGDRPILAVLETLVAWWFFSAGEVAETMSLLAHGTAVPRRLRRVANVVENMRVAIE